MLSTNCYLYNGKELDTDFGLDWYHYGARMYDPAIARFTGVDPISDQFPHVSTYNYAENEPIGSIDLHGLQRLRATNLNSYQSEKDRFNSYPKIKRSTTHRRMLIDLSRGYQVQTETANNLFELVLESLKGTDIVYLTGEAAESIENDPALTSLQTGLENRFSSHERFGEEVLFDTGQETVTFGGTRGSFLNLDDFTRNNDVATNELTWMLRNAQVKWWAETDKEGNLNMSFHVFDILDLFPSGDRGTGYNVISTILGTIYHGGMGGNLNMQTRAEIDTNTEVDTNTENN